MKKSLKTKIKFFLSGILFAVSGGNVRRINSPKKWISNYYRTAILMKKFYNFSVENYFYYLSVVVNKYDESSEEWNEIKESFLSCFKTSSDEEKMFIYKMMYFTGVFDSDVTECVVDFAKNTKSAEYRYWVTMDLGVMTFRYQKAVYNDYYNHRRELLNVIAKENVIASPNKSLKTTNVIKKICVITYVLHSDELDSARRVVTMMVNGLSRQGLEVTVINLNSFLTDEKNFMSVNPLLFDKNMADKTKLGFDKDVKVRHICDLNFSKRLNTAFKEICNCNPDIILDIADDYSPLSVDYSKYFCTVYQPLRSIGVSTNFYKVLIGGGKEAYREENEKCNFIDLSNVIDWCVPEYMPCRKQIINKEQIVLDKQAFIIVTIGNNDFYIDKELADLMGKLLSSENHIVWLLVGRKAPQYMHESYPILFEQDKIIEWGFEDDLLSLCCVCDISLRPNMKGGSGGTAIAAKAGLPIVLTKYRCDPMRWLGQNYYYNDSYRDCIEEIKKLVSNKDYYIQKKEITRTNIEKALDTHEKWKELLTLLEDIKNQYNEENIDINEQKYKN